MTNQPWTDKQIDKVIASIEKEKHIEITKSAQIESICLTTGVTESEVNSHVRATIEKSKPFSFKKVGESLPTLAKVLFVGALAGMLVNFSGEGRKTLLTFIAGGFSSYVIIGQNPEGLEDSVNRSVAKGVALEKLRKKLDKDQLTDEDKLLIYAAAVSQIPLTTAKILYSCPDGHSKVWKYLDDSDSRAISIKDNEINWEWEDRK